MSWLALPICPHCAEYADEADSTWCEGCGRHLTDNAPYLTLERATLGYARRLAHEAVEAAAGP